MGLTIALLWVGLAGVMNGSFALPIKHIKRWQFENIWLVFSIWAFALMPWAFAHLFGGSIMSVYQAAPKHLLIMMCIGGVLFGFGQVGFCLAMEMIGLGLGFVINIGLGTALGFFVPLVVLHPHEMLSRFGLSTLLGTLLIIIGLLYCFSAGRQRDKQQKKKNESSNENLFFTGVVLSIMAGIFSALQNFTFAITAPMQNIALSQGMSHLAASVVLWPGFLLCAFVPYAGFMLYRLKKNGSFKNFAKPGLIKYLGVGLVMGILWYGSLGLYSKASMLIGALGPVVGWPLFMVLIILVSNFWGWRHNEWKGCDPSIHRRLLTGILLMVLAVLVLAYSISLGH